MLRFTLFFSLLYFSLAALAQSTQFDQVFGSFPDSQFVAPILATRNGEISLSDVDNDGDDDLFVSGNNGSHIISRLYLNENSRLVETDTNQFIPLWNSAHDFGDIDADGDFDLIIMGSDASSNIYTKLYQNEAGFFSEILDFGQASMTLGDVEFFDFDNDSDQDIIITGYEATGEAVIHIYENDNGVFDLSTVANVMDGVAEGKLTVFDYNNDGFLDVFLFGQRTDGELVSKLYANYQGVFEEVLSSSFADIFRGDCSVADINNDGYLDLFLVGRASPNISISKLYMNNSGIFSEFNGSSFQGGQYSRCHFIDLDVDGYHELLLTGSFNGESATRLYENINGNLVLSATTSFVTSVAGDIACADLDANGFEDILITGGTNIASYRLYTNSEGVLYEATGSPFTAGILGNLESIDANNDGWMDILSVGLGKGNQGKTTLYWNNMGKYYPDSTTEFTPFQFGKIAVSDVNLDGWDDFIVIGDNVIGPPQIELYLNQGGVFNKDLSIPFDTLDAGEAIFFDFDTDGDDDLYLSGIKSNSSYSKLYRNLSGEFEEVVNFSIPGFYNNSVDAKDVNSDGYPDLAICGISETEGRTTKLFLNAGGNGNFYEYSSTTFIPVAFGTIGLEDLDNDMDLDLVVSGQTSSWFPVLKVYLNQNGQFIEDTVNNLEGVDLSSCLMEDFNLDGFIDIFVVGNDEVNKRRVLYYENIAGTFTQTNIFDLGTSEGAALTFDFDNDNRPDLLYSGRSIGGDQKTRMYRNITCAGYVINTGIQQDGIVLTALQSGVDYQWLDCLNNNAIIVGEVNQSLNPTQNGEYAVEITDVFCGVKDTSICFSIADAGLSSNIDTGFLTLFPNPTSGEINLIIKSDSEFSEVCVYSTVGTKIFEGRFPNNEFFTLDIDTEAAIYFVTVLPENLSNRETVKVVKME